MLVGEALAEERDRADVLQRPGVDARRDETASRVAEDQELARYSGFVDDSGEGRWTVMAALEEAVPADVLSAALYARFRSREKEGFADKLLSAMRNQFGGHVEPKAAD